MKRRRVLLEAETEADLSPQWATITGAVDALAAKPIVTARYDAYDDDEIITPPAMTYNRPTRLGGVHMSAGGKNGYGNWLWSIQGSTLVMSDNDFGVLMQASEVNRDTISVVFVRPEEYDEDTPGGNWQWPASQSRAIALDWMAHIYPTMDRNTFKPTYLEFMNEPDPADAYGIARASEFVQWCMEDAEAHGYKTAIWAWTAGLPRSPTIAATDFAQAEGTLETLKWAAEHGHALAVHEGSVNDERRLFKQAYDDKTALRYRYIKALMDAKGYPMPPVVITEAYQVDGYRKPDWDDWRWYLTELAKDDYVLGCAWFTLGDYEFSPGQSVNIAGQLPGYAALSASLPEVGSWLIL